MNDLRDAANPTLTDFAPSAEIPEPGPKTVRYCANCDAEVEPGGKGHCPACGRFLPDNLVALVHGGRRATLAPERESRRAELRAEVWRDLGGDVPPIIREVAEDFVSACVLRDQVVEYLEAIGPLTQRGTRRAAMDLYLATSARIERLSVQLGAYRAEVKPNHEPSANYPGIDAMPASALEQLQALLLRQINGESLTDRELGAVDVLRAAMRGKVSLPPDPDAFEAVAAVAAVIDVEPVGVEVVEPGDAVGARRAPSPPPPRRAPRTNSQPEPEPAPEPDSEVWRTVHGNEPVEVERRAREATAVMRSQFGKPHPWDE